MDKNRVEGAVHEAKGTVKETAGKLTGDLDTEAAGKAEKTGGKAQGIVGKTKDTIKDALS